jgi:hypothetical protein
MDAERREVWRHLRQNSSGDEVHCVTRCFRAAHILGSFHLPLAGTLLSPPILSGAVRTTITSTRTSRAGSGRNDFLVRRTNRDDHRRPLCRMLRRARRAAESRGGTFHRAIVLRCLRSAPRAARSRTSPVLTVASRPLARVVRVDLATRSCRGGTRVCRKSGLTFIFLPEVFRQRN